MNRKFKSIVAVILSIVMVITSIGVQSETGIDAYAAEDYISIYENYFLTDNVEIYFNVTDHWDGGYNATVTLTNISEEKIDNWRLRYITSNEISNIWNATIKKKETNSYIIGNLGWNQDINPGESVSFGYTSTSTIVDLPTIGLITNIEAIVSTDDYKIQYTTNSDWETGFNGAISVTNISDTVIEDWKLEFSFDGSISQIWNAQIKGCVGNLYSIDNAGYNGNIGAGETISFGFMGTKDIQDVPSNFVLKANAETEEIAFDADEELIELADGKISKEYIEKAIYSRLLMNGQSIENLCLSDDFDGDGLTFKQEYEYDTNPFEADTDNDGLSDYEEVFYYLTNPWDEDTDGDGLMDGTEVVCGLDPLAKDSDGDGVVDGEIILSQKIRLRGGDFYSLEQEQNVPWIVIEGKGDFNNKIKVESIRDNKAITDIESLVGTPYEFSHDELNFEKSILGFDLSDIILNEYDINDLAIAYYDYDTGEIIILDTKVDIDEGTIYAEVEHYSTYFIINLANYLKNIADSFGEEGLQGSRADIVFVIDTTGSMANAINEVKENIKVFAGWLEDEKIDTRLGLVEYRDIYEDGIDSTKNYGWFTNVGAFASRLSTFIASGGGDAPESTVDALYSACNMFFRTGVDRYIVLVTDAGYKLGTVEDSKADMTDAIERLVEEKISISVATGTNITCYDELVSATDGIKVNIYTDFKDVFGELLNKMKTESAEGFWITLADGSRIHLDKNPEEGDCTVDTDGDGIPDIDELIEKLYYTYTDKNNVHHSYYGWTFVSNPAAVDTDGDGIEDSYDFSPKKYDYVPVESNEEHILFNNGDKWLMYNYTAEDYVLSNKLSTEEYLHVRDDIVTVNNAHNYNLEELEYICLTNLYGCQIYMTQCDYKNSDDSLELFEKIVGRKAKFFKHTGLFWWSDYEEVEYGTRGGFWTGAVRTEADYNVNMEYLFVDWDLQTVLTTFITVGAVILATIFVKEVAVPIIVENVSALFYCIKTFGVYNGINFFLTFGTETKPLADGIVSAVQADMSDGDCDIVDIIECVSKETTAKSSVLRKNLIDSGIKVPEYKNAAHHIVAGGCNKTSVVLSREILAMYGIDINSAINGVFLPTEKNVTIAMYHLTLHTNKYYNEVYELLSKATCKEEAIDILKYIAECLLNGTFVK